MNFKEHIQKTINIKRYDSDINQGLTLDQVKERIDQGLINENVSPKFKTTRQIFASNIFTYFNILTFILALCVLLVGSFRNVFFIGVVICNIFIGIIQELRARHAIKKLSIISQPEVIVIRQGKRYKLKTDHIVLDDIIIFEYGNQIAADSIIKKGTVEVNESLLTGEADLAVKKEGDKLISGSFIVSGKCIAKVENIGKDTYASHILLEVGKYKKTSSEITKYINTLVKIVAIILGPIGLIRFYKEFYLLHNTIQSSVVLTVASVIGMIPEGIVLLTSITLVIGIIRLSKLNTLTQGLFSLETLAKVDVLCLDKTGTLTEGNIKIEEIIPLGNKYNIEYIHQILVTICKTLSDKGTTTNAIKDYYKDVYTNYTPTLIVEEKIHFSSERKWSGIKSKDKGSFIMGAPEVLLKDNIDEYQSIIEPYINDGKRILLIGHSDNKISTTNISKIDPMGFVVMEDKIRSDATGTLKFFNDQGVNIKIISGDNPVSVSRIAKLVEIKESEKCIDVSHLKNYEEIKEAVRNYNIFGRAKPEHKRMIIKAYKELGHTVGMIGDGVNDILALKDADCSIAMAEGSDAARQISKFVLLDSKFTSIPNIVNEGRRAINNIQRAASMFLIKNIYSFVLSLILLFFATSYPFQPLQLTLLGSLTIGIPSFFLALEKNKDPIKGNFIKNVVKNALPPSIAIIINILIINVIYEYFNIFTLIQTSTIAVILTGMCNLMTLINLSKPFHLKHTIIVGLFFICFIISIIFFKKIFFLSSINLSMLIIIILLGSYSYWQINIITQYKLVKKSKNVGSWNL